MTVSITIEVRCAGTERAMTYAFNALPITIGRDPANDLSLGRRFVSARHALIEEVQGRLRVLDLDSTNGVSVRGADGRWTRLPSRVAHDLEVSGFEFGIAQYVLRVRRESPSDDEAPSFQLAARPIARTEAPRTRAVPETRLVLAPWERGGGVAGMCAGRQP